MPNARSFNGPFSFTTPELNFLRAYARSYFEAVQTARSDSEHQSAVQNCLDFSRTIVNVVIPLFRHLHRAVAPSDAYPYIIGQCQDIADTLRSVVNAGENSPAALLYPADYPYIIGQCQDIADTLRSVVNADRSERKAP